MRKAVAIVLITLLSAPSTALAAPQGAAASTPAPRDGASGLRAGAMREATRLARELTLFQTTSEERAPRRSWIGRHPTLFGAAVGAGAGMVVAVSNTNELFCTGNDEDCLAYGASGVAFGAAVGAGVGALAGYVVGKLRPRDHRRVGADRPARQR